MEVQFRGLVSFKRVEAKSSAYSECLDVQRYSEKIPKFHTKRSAIGISRKLDEERTEDHGNNRSRSSHTTREQARPPHSHSSPFSETSSWREASSSQALLPNSFAITSQNGHNPRTDGEGFVRRRCCCCSNDGSRGIKSEPRNR